MIKSKINENLHHSVVCHAESFFMRPFSAFKAQAFSIGCMLAAANCGRVILPMLTGLPTTLKYLSEGCEWTDTACVDTSQSQPLYVHFNTVFQPKQMNRINILIQLI